MLRFIGSDCRRYLGLTWYDRMDRLLMTLGFNESKVDSNIFFNIEAGMPVMLLLYVDDLFLIEVARRRLPARFEMKDLDMMHYFLQSKAMTTPMASNLKLLSVASSESVDAMMYPLEEIWGLKWAL